MQHPPGGVHYAVGQYRLDPGQKLVSREGVKVALAPKAVDLLITLAAAEGRVVSKSDLLAAVWPESWVDESTLAKLVFTLRRELGALPDGRPFIETIPRRGYRLLADVRRIDSDAAAPGGQLQLPETEPRETAVRASKANRLMRLTAALSFVAVAAFIASGLSSPQPRDQIHILVMPFAAQSGVGNSFAASLEEIVTARLTSVAGVKVIPPMLATSSGALDPQALARELGATFVLRGNIAREGDRVRVSYAITSLGDRASIDAATLEAPVSDLFVLQERVAESVGSHLRLHQTLLRQNDPLLATPENRQTYLRAIALLRPNVLESNPDQALAHLILLERSSKEKSPLVTAAIGRAYVDRFASSHDESDLDLAERYAERAAGIDAGEARVRALRGSILRWRGQLQPAVVHLRAALALDPDAPDVLLELGRVYDLLGRESEAAQTYSYILETHPHCAVCVNSVAAFHMTHGRVEYAVEMFRRAVSLAPETAAFRGNLAATLLKRGDVEEAATVLQDASRFRRTSHLANLRGLAEYLRHDYAAAEQGFMEASRLDPRSAAPWGNLGCTYRFLGQREKEAEEAYDRAILLSRRALQTNPRDVAERARLAEYLAKRGDLSAARREIAIVMKEPGVHDGALITAAIVEMSAGHKRSAVQFLRKARANGYSPTIFARDPQFDSLRSEPEYAALVDEARAERRGDRS